MVACGRLSSPRLWNICLPVLVVKKNTAEMIKGRGFLRCIGGRDKYISLPLLVSQGQEGGGLVLGVAGIRDNSVPSYISHDHLTSINLVLDLNEVCR